MFTTILYNCQVKNSLQNYLGITIVTHEDREVSSEKGNWERVGCGEKGDCLPHSPSLILEDLN